MSAKLNKRRALRSRQQIAKAQWAARAARQATAIVQPRVSIFMDLDVARSMSLGAADLLCWARGWRAARPNDDDQPEGVYQVRDLKDALDRAINKAEGHARAAGLPF